jgi:D-alanyl-D-alanine carboxypeptidase
VTTARDMATLARHIIRDFPNEYRYFSVPSFVFHGRMVYNHDRMLITYAGADGLKTGFTNDAGHNLVTSAMRGNVRLIGVVLGAATNVERDVDMSAQLDQGFDHFDIPRVTVAAAAPPRFPSLIGHAEAATLPRTLRPAAERQQPKLVTVQVGAFGSETAARHAAQTAAARMDGEPLVEPATVNGRKVWRAQVLGAHVANAAAACTPDPRHHSACQVLPVRG